MGGFQSKRFDEPDEVVTLPLLTEHVVMLGEVYVARTVVEPGWSWSEHVKPVVGTPSCGYHHQGVVLSGKLEIEMDSGVRRRIGPGEAYEVPPGHDGRVIGDEPAVFIEFRGVRGFGKPAEIGERVVATLLVTDIVDSTAIATRLGDAAWKELFGHHGEQVRQELDRYRGLEVTTTGDGFPRHVRRSSAGRSLCCGDPRLGGGRRLRDPRGRSLGRGRAPNGQHPGRRGARGGPGARSRSAE